MRGEDSAVLVLSRFTPPLRFQEAVSTHCVPCALLLSWPAHVPAQQLRTGASNVAAATVECNICIQRQ
jgi:hypothetical protein